MSSGEDAGCESGLAEIFSSFLANFAFETWIDRNEKPGLAFVDMSSGVVQGNGEELRGRQMNMDCASVNTDILRRDLSEVNAGNGLAMNLKQDPVTREEWRKDAAFAVAGDHLIHRVRHGFEAGEPANLHDNGRL